VLHLVLQVCSLRLTHL
jgi:hypothetical protein